MLQEMLSLGQQILLLFKRQCSLACACDCLLFGMMVPCWRTYARTTQFRGSLTVSVSRVSLSLALCALSSRVSVYKYHDVPVSSPILFLAAFFLLELYRYHYSLWPRVSVYRGYEGNSRRCVFRTAQHRSRHSRLQRIPVKRVFRCVRSLHSI